MSITKNDFVFTFTWPDKINFISKNQGQKLERKIKEKVEDRIKSNRGKEKK